MVGDIIITLILSQFNHLLNVDYYYTNVVTHLYLIFSFFTFLMWDLHPSTEGGDKEPRSTYIEHLERESWELNSNSDTKCKINVAGDLNTKCKIYIFSVSNRDCLDFDI